MDTICPQAVISSINCIFPMNRIVSTIILIAILTLAGKAQNSYKERLAEDLVSIRTDSMIFDRAGFLFDVKKPLGKDTVWVKFHCLAPLKGLISRDNFVLMSILSYLQFMPPDMKLIEKKVPRGKLTLEYTISMEEQSVIIQKTDHRTGSTRRSVTP